MGFGESGGIIEVFSEKDLPQPKSPGRPNTTYNYNDGKGVKTSRTTGPDGQPIKDTHNWHGGAGHTFPHSHNWSGGKLGPGY